MRVRLQRRNGGFGILVNACADLTLESPELSDDSGEMQIGVSIASGGNNVHITGKPKITGYTTSAFLFDGPGAQWHASVVDAFLSVSGPFKTVSDEALAESQ